MSDRYAVAGNPVDHSRSPAIHAAFAEATGQALAYGRLLCPLDAFEPTVRAFANGGARGCNVTVPFKLEAFRLANRHSVRAALAEAANVLRFDADGWFGDNTDGIGLVFDIERNAGRPLAGTRVLLIGAGGAAAGALGPLIAARPAEVRVANRTVASADALVRRHRAWAERHGVSLHAAALDDAGRAYDVVVNATATSLQGAAVPVSADVLRPGSLALDMMYGPAAQGFLDWAAAHGAQPRDGLGMLVEQAAEAFLLWRGMRPDAAPVLAMLRGPGAMNSLREALRLLALVIVCALALQLYFLARVALMTVVDPQSTSFQRSEIWRLLTQKHQVAWSQQWTDYGAIALPLKRAVIALQDAGFVDHGGVEWDAIERARGRNQKAEARIAKLATRARKPTTPPREPKIVGGSTISQQLAKNLFLAGERTIVRKGQEFAITMMLETLLSKQRILEIYLNNVEWGEGVFGAEAAARHYFHVGARQLGNEPAARLAVMLPAPKRFEQRPGSAYVVGRASTVMARMAGVETP